MLFGTLSPLFIEALGLGKISVGPPYFNLMFLLPVLPLVALLGRRHAHRLAHDAGQCVASARLRWPAVAAVIVGVAVPFVVFGTSSVLTMLSRLDRVVGVRELAARSAAAARAPHGRAADARPARHVPRALRRRRVHARRHDRVRLQLRESTSARGPATRIEAGGYEFVFNGMRTVEGPNFVADEGEFELRDEGVADRRLDAADPHLSSAAGADDGSGDRHERRARRVRRAR